MKKSIASTMSSQSVLPFSRMPRVLPAFSTSLSVVSQTKNYNTGISYGLCNVDDMAYFYKKLPREVVERERIGYKNIEKIYPVTKQYGVVQDENNLYILYEYIWDLDAPGGMLSDCFEQIEIDIYHRVAKMFLKGYCASISYRKTSTHDIFFRKRIKSRILPWYSDAMQSEWHDKKVLLNNNAVTVHLSQMINSLIGYFSQSRHAEWCVLSQGDPAEWNIATKPLLLDYEAGGYIPLAAELSVAIALTSHYGDFLARKYNPDYFSRRGLSKDINSPIRAKSGELIRSVAEPRVAYLRELTNTAFLPLMEKIKLSEEFLNDYRHYYLMKMLAVFPPEKLDQDDLEYILAKSQQVFDETPKARTLEDLIRISIS